MKDYYSILGVSRSAGQAEIKRAFRRLAVRYHPDKNPAPEAAPLFYDINEAYDTLGDPQKRAGYDMRLDNPLAAPVEDFVQRHPDPAYRRRRTAPRPPPGPPASYIAMRDSLPYMMWICRAGLALSFLFFADYFLPYREREETIREITAVTHTRGVAYHVIRTESGREIKLYEGAASGFSTGRSIQVTHTPIFGSVMYVGAASGAERLRIGYMYRALVFFPVLLMIVSALAVIFRKKVEFCFSLNLAAAILLIITFILL